MRKVSNFVSLFAYAIVAYPLIRYIETYDAAFLKILLAIVLGMLFVKLTRMLPVWSSLQLRPEEACDCSILNDGGSAKNKIGLPSGHVFATTLTIALLWIHNPRASTAFFGAIVVVMVSIARIEKKCHDILQVSAGAATALMFAYVSSKILSI